MTTTLPPIPHWSFPDLTDPAARTEARKAIVKPLWDAGLSAGDIMFHFVGASRNAIIGLIHRNHWQRSPEVNRSNVVRKNQERRKATPNPVKAKVKRVALDVDPDIKIEKVDWINKERPPLAGTTPVSMLALPHNEGTMCRFTVIGGYCGQPSGDHMYCEPHRRFMYQPRREE